MRSELNFQKLRQASGASQSTGMFTSPQVTTQVDSVVKKSGSRRARRQSRNSGPSRNSG